MKKNKPVLAEICGFFVAVSGTVLLWNLYELSDSSTIGVLFGAVNSSVWEKAKCVSICYFVCALTELLSVRPRFYAFVAAKALGLSVSLIVFSAVDSFFGGDFYSDFIALCIALFCGVLCSYLLMVSGVNLRPFFAPACFLLLLIFMMTFSFTAFAPRLELFRDPYTGCYGIIPNSFDMGAISLGT